MRDLRNRFLVGSKDFWKNPNGANALPKKYELKKRTVCDEDKSIVNKKRKQCTKRIQKSNTRAITSTCKAVLRPKAVGAAEYIIEKEKVLTNEEAGEIASKFNIGSGRTLRRLLKRTDSEMTIELYEDCILPGRTAEITSEYVESAF